LKHSEFYYSQNMHVQYKVISKHQAMSIIINIVIMENGTNIFVSDWVAFIIIILLLRINLQFNLKVMIINILSYTIQLPTSKGSLGDWL
jgi:hypothetical protein